jgi:hypothetical protein
MASVLPSEAESAQEKAYVTYTFPHSSVRGGTSMESTVTLLEARSVISGSGTTGLRTWEAALVLGSYLTSETGKSVIRGKHILELGAGTGVLSILCAKYLEFNGVVATDGDEAVVDAIKTNAFLNRLDSDEPNHTAVQTAALRWGFPINASTFQEDYGMEFPDIILGADVVSKSQFEELSHIPAVLDSWLCFWGTPEVNSSFEYARNTSEQSPELELLVLE